MHSTERGKQDFRAFGALVFGCLCAVAVMQLDAIDVSREELGLIQENPVLERTRQAKGLEVPPAKESGSDAFATLSKVP